MASKAKQPEPKLEDLIARRVVQLRAARGWSLADLAKQTGVSKAMISRIERAQSSPTAMTLGRLASGLGVTLADILASDGPVPSPLRRKASQPVWRDPASGYVRRQVAAPDGVSGVELVEIELPSGAEIRYPPWSANAYGQCLWVTSGSVRVQYGTDSFDLNGGDSVDLRVDRPMTFSSRGGRCCRYLLVIRAPSGTVWKNKDG